VISATGSVYVSAENGVLHALNARTGAPIWSFDGGGSYGGEDLSTSALIFPSGEILWPGPRDRLFALSPSGQVRWSVTTPAAVEVSPAIATNGIVVFGLGPSGSELFDLDAGGKFDSYPALAPTGTLLVGGDNGTLYAIGYAVLPVPNRVRGQPPCRFSRSRVALQRQDDEPARRRDPVNRQPADPRHADDRVHRRRARRPAGAASAAGGPSSSRLSEIPGSFSAWIT
jgi:hypothetical protein